MVGMAGLGVCVGRVGVGVSEAMGREEESQFAATGMPTI